ncbi:hypothetical protein ACDI16_02510 [Oceanobacillus caeni]
MAKFKVLQPYKDLEIGRKLKKNEEIEMTVKRSEEVAETLEVKGFKGEFLERIDNKKDEKEQG